MGQIDALASNIGAINTIRKKDNHWQATNTDALGAFHALQTKLNDPKDKNVLLLGAGGAAKAIAYILHDAGATLTIANRTTEHIKPFVEKYNAKAFGLSDNDIKALQASHFDAVINTIPNEFLEASQPKLPERIIKSIPIVMDINLGNENTLFIQAAKMCGCEFIVGDEMYQAQAEAQQVYWRKAMPEKKEG